GDSPETREFAQIWRAADKVVYSASLDADAVDTPRTRLERTFDPAAVARMKAESPRDLTVGGPTLAAAALRAGLVDECHIVVHPVPVGGGTPAFPVGLRVELELLHERRLGSGVIHTHYRVRR